MICHVKCKANSAPAILRCFFLLFNCILASSLLTGQVGLSRVLPELPGSTCQAALFGSELWEGDDIHGTKDRQEDHES